MSARTSDSSPATFSASPRVSRMCWQKALSDEQITELIDRRVAAFRETRIAGVTAI